MFLRFGMFAMILCWCFSLNGQTATDTLRNDYALLWEITGNDLPGPSYVFGSMHVRYKSVFEFPDSLLICLQASDAVANEIHLDSAMQRILEIYAGQDELSVDSSYIEFIHEKILRTDSLAGTNTKDSTDRNFRSLLKDLGEGQALRTSGLMPTMLDAHLMEIGRRWGKKHYGLEKIDEHLYEGNDQFGASDRLQFSWFANDADELLRLYYAGNLAPIDEFIKESPAQFNQLALIARNYIMVESMKRIMPNERLFSVVGAAHLPGEEGIIELLRKEGYNLRRVIPTFTGLRDSMLIPEIERPWPSRNGENNTFSYAMPLDFQYVNYDGAYTSYLSFDIGRGVSYLLLTVSTLPLDNEDFDETFFVDDGYQIEDKKPIEYEGLSGYRYELLKPGEDLEYYRAYTFNYDQTLYYLQIGAYEQSTLTELTDVDTFLSKFHLLKTNRDKWVKVVDTLGGFELQLPDHYTYSKSVLNDGYIYNRANNYPLHQYRAGFEEPTASVWLQYYDLPPAQEYENELVQLEEGLDYLIELYGIDIEVQARDTFMNYPRWILQGEYLDNSLQFEGQLIARANRLYLLSQVDVAKGKKTKKFLRSFQLLPFDSTQVTASTELVKDQLALYLPGEPSQKVIKQRRNFNTAPLLHYKVHTLDPATSATYQANAYLFPKIFSVKDSAAYCEQFFTQFLDGDSELLNTNEIELTNGTKATEQLYATKHAQLFKKIQFYHRGRYLVRKQMIAPLAELNSKKASHFFRNDEWSDSPTLFPLFEVRSTDLLAGLQAEEADDLYAALKALDAEYSLNTDDLPNLREVFLNNHWSAHEVDYFVIKKLLPVFLRNGEYGQQVLQQIYQEEELSSSLKETILSTLVVGAKDENLTLLFRLLEKEEQSLDNDLAVKVFAPFNKNPGLTVAYWSNFVQLLKKDRDPLFLWELTQQVLTQDTIDNTAILASSKLFATRGKERLALLQEKEISSTVFGLYKLFPSSPAMLLQAQEYYNRKDVDWASLEAAAYLLEKGQATGKRKWNQLLKDDKLRVPFLRLLNEYQLLDAVNNKYYQQSEIAQFLLLEKLAKPGSEISNLKMVDNMEVLFRTEARKVYLFTFDLNEDKNRLGVAGFFARDQQERAFLDENFVNYTSYAVTSRRRERKAQQLVEEMREWDKDGYRQEQDDIIMIPAPPAYETN